MNLAFRKWLKLPALSLDAKKLMHCKFKVLLFLQLHGSNEQMGPMLIYWQRNFKKAFSACNLVFYYIVLLGKIKWT